MKTYAMSPRGEWQLEVHQAGKWVPLLRNVPYQVAKTALDDMKISDQSNYRLHYLGHEHPTLGKTA